MPSLSSNSYTNGSGARSTNNPAAGGSSSMDGAAPAASSASVNDANFDILEWHPAHQSCQRFFLDHAQYEQATQAVCALVNIRLPFQWLQHPVVSSSPSSTAATPSSMGGGAAGTSSAAAFGPYTLSGKIGSPSASRSAAAGRSSSPHPAATTFVSVIPYIRRMVVTGFDKPGILHGFFGDDWAKGVGPFVECERRNYLFAAKHGGWRSCKKQYDMGSTGGSDETVPFMKPLDGARAEELTAAEQAWSQWLAMEDWMVGPRAPETSPDNTQTTLTGGGNGRRNVDMVDGVDGYDE